MFLLRKTHEALVAAKDAQIKQLQDEVKWLRFFIQPERSLSPNVQLEADLAIEGRQDQIQEDDAKAAIDAEAARLLSGSY